LSTHIRDRIARKLETLGEDRLYQVLDYVEFLESRYAQRPPPVANPLQRFADGIEDRLRTGGVSAVRVAEAMGLLNRAVGVLGDVATGVAAAGKSVATDLASAASRVGTAPGTTPAGGPGAGTPPTGVAPESAGASAPPAAPASPAPGSMPGGAPGAPSTTSQPGTP
jgi:hypothetical protein